MTTKIIEERIDCTDKEELPKKSLERAIESIKNNADMQERLKNMVCFCVSLKGGEHACSVELKFVSKEIATGSPEKQMKEALTVLAEGLIKALKGDNND